MKSYITKFLDPLAIASGVAGAVQGVVGAGMAIAGSGKLKKLLAQRKGYMTPDEVFQILQAAENNLGGLDPETLQLITGQADRAFSSSVTAATRLGADPNQLSALLDQRIQAGFKIGSENQLANIRSFEKYLSALNLVADNKAAEQKSKEDILKDKIQAASAQTKAGFDMIGSGLSTSLAGFSSDKTSKLFSDNQSEIESLKARIAELSKTG